MTDLATLAIKVDASEADAGSASLDKLTAAGARTEASAGKVTAATKSASDAAAGLAAQAENLRAKFDPLYAAEKRHADTLILADKALRQNLLTQQQYNEIIGQSKAQMTAHIQGLEKVKDASGSMRAGMQQLSFQIGDVATQLSMGAAPMQVFAAQASQVTGAIGLMAGEAKGFIGFIGGPWGQIIIAATTLLGTMAAAHFAAGDASKAQADAADDLHKAIDSLNTATQRESQSAYASAQASIVAAEGYRTRAVEARKAALAEMELARSRLADAQTSQKMGAGTTLYGYNPAMVAASAEGQIGLLDGKIKKLNQDIAKSDQTIRLQQGKVVGMLIAEQFDKSAAATGRYQRAQDALNDRLAAGKISMNAYAVETAKLRGTLEREQAAVEASDRSHRKHNDALSDGAKAAREAARAYEQLAKWMADTRMEAQGNVGKLAEDMLKRNSEWSDGEFAAKNGPVLGKLDTKAMEEADKLKQAALANYLDMLDAVQARTDSAADAMAKAFGKVGGAIGDAASLLVEYGNRQKAIDKQAEDGLITQASARRQTFQNQVQGFGALAGAAKGLFNEHSKGYKAMEAAEKAFAAIQLINTAKSVVAGAAKMFEFLGPFAFPAVAAMIGVMASLGFKGGGGGGQSFNLKAYQAAQGTGSVLGDGSAKSESISSSLELMAANSDKNLEYSNAMVRSLRSIESNIGSLSGLLARQLGISGGAFDTSGLGLGSNTSSPFASGASGLVGMAVGTALLGPIGGIIGGAMGAVTKFITKIPIIGGLIGGIGKALFGTKVTKTLQDQGILFNAESIQGILENGIDGKTYQTIKTQTKKKMFGITTSNKTKIKDQFGALDGGVEDQVAMLIGSMRDGILSAASVLGIEGADAVLDAFKVDLGKISLKDMTGTEIQEQLNAIFSKLGDDMALAATSNLSGAAADVVAAVQETAASPLSAFQAVLEKARTVGAKGGWPFAGMGAQQTQQAAAQQAAATSFLSTFQKVGEGAFETLMRLVKDYQTLDVQLASIGRTFGAVGVSSLEAREALIGLFGSLDDFVDQTQFYRENFLTAAEQMAPIQKAVSAELSRLGLSSVDSIEKFKAVVNGLDLTTAAGQSLYAALMALAPGFSAVEKYQQEQAQAAREAQQAAYKKSVDYRQLEMQIMEASGNALGALASRRRLEWEATDESLRGMLETVWYWQDRAEAEQKAAQALAEVTNRFKQFADELRSFRDELDGSAGGGLTYRQSMAKLMAAGGLAAAGDEAALSALSGVGREFLSLSKASAESALQYQRDVALVRGYLNQAIAVADGGAGAASSGMGSFTGTPASIASTAGQANLGIIDAVNGLRAEVAAQRAEVRAANEALVIANNKIARLHERWDRGGAVAVATDSDTPLKVESA